MSGRRSARAISGIAAVVAGTLMSSARSAAVPAPPVLSAPRVSSATVTLSWTVPFGTTAIRLQAGTAPGLSNLANAVVGAISTYTVTAVPNGTYYVRVRAIDPSGESAPSNEVTVVVGGGPACLSPPGAPTLSEAIVIANLVGFRWRPATAGCAPTSFALQVGSAAGQSNLAIVNVGDLQAFSATAPNGRYYVRVVAQNTFGLSAPSNEVVAIVGSAPLPPAPAPGPPPLPSLTGLWQGLVRGITPNGQFLGVTNAIVEITQSGTRVVGRVRGASPGMGISFDLSHGGGSGPLESFRGTLTFEGRPGCSWEGSIGFDAAAGSGRFVDLPPYRAECGVTWAVTLRRLP